MEENRGKTGGKRGKTGGNGGKRGKTGGKRGANGGGWGTVMNGSRSSGLLHCHYFLYAYPCLCCSHLHTDMSDFHLHEGILYVRIQHLVSQKWASSSDISKALTRLGTSSKSFGYVRHPLGLGCLTRESALASICFAKNAPRRIIKRGVWVGQKSGGWVLSNPPPPDFPRFPPVFPRFSPFFSVFPRFSLLPGTKRRLGTGTLDPC